MSASQPRSRSSYGARDSSYQNDSKADLTNMEANAAVVPARLANSSRRFLPVAIPQMNKGRGTPFQRLYAPELEGYNLSEQDFMDFIDTLNIVSAASPPFKILDIAGGVIGLVPYHWAQLASQIMKLTVMGGTAVVSKSRTDSFLNEANKQVFGPKGLRVGLITTDALMLAIGFPRERQLTLPLKASVPLDQQPKFHTRLLEGLRGYVSDTYPTELAPKNTATNKIDKLSAGMVKRNMESIDKKLMKENKKQMEDRYGKDQSRWADYEDETPGQIRRSRSVEKDLYKINKEADKRLRGRSPVGKVEAERNKEINKVLEKDDRKNRRRQRSRSKGRGEDDKLADKLLWIFVDHVSD